MDKLLSANPLLQQSALEQAALIRSGEISARELLEATLSQVQAQRHLNAFTLVNEEALEAADSIQPADPRPFAGVPMVIKELTPVTGEQWSFGSEWFAGHKAPADAYTVRRLRQAGFVLMGRTNSPEFGLVPVTEPRRFGSARNPWDPSRTPGGSSGGAAAAVASGILSVAHASDGGGSIRIPAACCGLVGLKPSRGRISAGPFLGDNLLSTQGVLSRTVADSAHLLDILSGYEVGDATWAPDPPEPFALTASRPPKALRIAVLTEPPLEIPLHPSSVQAVEQAARLLESLGHQVEWATPPGWKNPKVLEQFTLLWCGGAASTVYLGAELRQRPPQPSDVEALTWYLAQKGMQQPIVAHMAAVESLKNQARTMVAFFQQYDLLLTPALAEPPVPIGTINTESPDPEATFNRAIEFTPFTAIWNLTGQPAISLPLFVKDGLPLAVQLIAGPLQDGLLLSVAGQLEAAHGWNQGVS